MTVWKVFKFLDKNKGFSIGRYAIVVLNRPIHISKDYVVNIWNEACFRATVDGGTDQWYNFVSTLSQENKLIQTHPDLTSGDFDSIKPETLQYCKENAVNVVCTPNQDQTDFEKALKEVVKLTHGKIDSVVAVVEDSGRLDHIMSNLNTLYTAAKTFNSAPIKLFLLSSESLTWLLPAGSHSIDIPPSLVEAQATCGLIPLGHPCVVSTSGLKWNLDKDLMCFGGLISSCNTYSETCNGVITIETDSPLLWTMALLLDK